MQLQDSKKEEAQRQLKAASAERAKAQARLEFHAKFASDAAFGGGSIPQIPHSTPSVETPGAWGRIGGLKGIGNSAAAPVKDLAKGVSDTWNNWGGADGIRKSVGRFGGENMLYATPVTGAAMGILQAGAAGLNLGADVLANKENYWNTLMTGSDGGVKRKQLDAPIESIQTKDYRLPFEDTKWGGKLWGVLPGQEAARGMMTGLANTVSIPVTNALFGTRSVQGQRYRPDGTPIT